MNTNSNNIVENENGDRTETNQNENMNTYKTSIKCKKIGNYVLGKIKSKYTYTFSIFNNKSKDNRSGHFREGKNWNPPAHTSESGNKNPRQIKNQRGNRF